MYRTYKNGQLIKKDFRREREYQMAMRTPYSFNISPTPYTSHYQQYQQKYPPTLFQRIKQKVQKATQTIYQITRDFFVNKILDINLGQTLQDQSQQQLPYEQQFKTKSYQSLQEKLQNEQKSKQKSVETQTLSQQSCIGLNNYNNKMNLNEKRIKSQDQQNIEYNQYKPMKFIIDKDYSQQSTKMILNKNVYAQTSLQNSASASSDVNQKQQKKNQYLILPSSKLSNSQEQQLVQQKINLKQKLIKYDENILQNAKQQDNKRQAKFNQKLTSKQEKLFEINDDSLNYSSEYLLTQSDSEQLVEDNSLIVVSNNNKNVKQQNDKKLKNQEKQQNNEEDQKAGLKNNNQQQQQQDLPVQNASQQNTNNNKITLKVPFQDQNKFELSSNYDTTSEICSQYDKKSISKQSVDKHLRYSSEKKYKNFFKSYIQNQYKQNNQDNNIMQVSSFESQKQNLLLDQLNNKKFDLNQPYIQDSQILENGQKQKDQKEQENQDKKSMQMFQSISFEKPQNSTTGLFEQKSLFSTSSDQKSENNLFLTPQKSKKEDENVQSQQEEKTETFNQQQIFPLKLQKTEKETTDEQIQENQQQKDSSLQLTKPSIFSNLNNKENNTKSGLFAGINNNTSTSSQLFQAQPQLQTEVSNQNQNEVNNEKQNEVNAQNNETNANPFLQATTKSSRLDDVMKNQGNGLSLFTQKSQSNFFSNPSSNLTEKSASLFTNLNNQQSQQPSPFGLNNNQSLLTQQPSNNSSLQFNNLVQNVSNIQQQQSTNSIFSNITQQLPQSQGVSGGLFSNLNNANANTNSNQQQQVGLLNNFQQQQKQGGTGGLFNNNLNPQQQSQSIFQYANIQNSSLNIFENQNGSSTNNNNNNTNMQQNNELSMMNNNISMQQPIISNQLFGLSNNNTSASNLLFPTQQQNNNPLFNNVNNQSQQGGNNQLFGGPSNNLFDGASNQISSNSNLLFKDAGQPTSINQNKYQQQRQNSNKKKQSKLYANQC